MALANYVNVQQATGLDAADRTVNFLPLFHTAGINLHTLPLFLAGGASTVLSKFEVDPLLDLIGDGRVTILFGVPAIYQAISLLAALRRCRSDARAPLGLRRRSAAGEPDPSVPGQGRARLQRHGHDRDGPHRVPDGPGACGRADRLGGQAAAAVASAAGRCQGPRRRRRRAGRAAVPRPQHHARLFQQSATPPPHRRDGWLHSRRRRPGAMRTAITSSSTASRTCTSPAAKTSIRPRWRPCSPTTRPCSRRQCSACRTTTGARSATPSSACAPATCDAETLRVFVRTRLAAYKVPKHVTVVDDYPRTAAGKVQKHVLRKMLH